MSVSGGAGKKKRTLRSAPALRPSVSGNSVWQTLVGQFLAIVIGGMRVAAQALVELRLLRL